MATAKFKSGDLIHEEDMGLGIVEGEYLPEDGDVEHLYRCRGIDDEGEPEFVAREGLLFKITRRWVEEKLR